MSRRRKTRRPHGTGSLRPLASGRWQAIAPRDSSGRRISHTFDTRTEAEIWLRDQAGDLAGGGTYDAQLTTLEKFAQDWLAIKRTSKKTSTIDFYNRNLKNHILPELGHLVLADLTPARIQAHYAWLLENGSSAHVVRAVHRTLSACLGSAVDKLILRENPCRHVEQPGPPAADKREIVWTESEISTFRIATRGHIYENFFHLALATGMRRGELLGLRWNRIDWKSGLLRIDTTTVEPDAGGWDFGTPKSQQSDRTIKIGPGVIGALRAQQDLVDTLRKLAGKQWKENDLVFPTSVGTAIPGYQVSKEFTSLVEEIGLPRIVFHGIRHTFITSALDQGIPPKTVAEYVGDRVETILAHYTHRTGRGGDQLAKFGNGMTEIFQVEIDVEKKDKAKK